MTDCLEIPMFSTCCAAKSCKVEVQKLGGVHLAEKPRPPSRFYTVTLLKDTGATLGLELETTDGRTAVVTSIAAPGIAADWNKSCGDRQIQAGDCVLSVNGVSGNSLDIVAKLREDVKLEIKFAQAEEQRILISKQGRPLGLHVTHGTNSKSVVIEEIVEGAVADWNSENPGRQLKPGDRILQVDGNGDPEAFLKQMNELSKFEMVCHVYP